MVWRVRRPTTAVAAMAAALAVFGAPAYASADEITEDEVNQCCAEAVIESVQPALVTPSTENFTISGTVTNTGDEPLVDLQVLPRWGQWRPPLEDRDEVRRALSDPDFVWGPGTGTSQRYADPFPVEYAGTVAPGETVPFELAFANEDLNAPEWFSQQGVHPIGVDVKAGPDSNNRPTFDTARTVITWLPDDVELPEVPVAMLWPVTARPSLMPSGEFYDDSLAPQLASNGRLDTLVTAAQQTSSPLTWMIDPDVLTTVDTMADGYQVRTADGLSDGDGVGDAASWRDSLDSATAGDEVQLLPAAQPDLEAIRHVDSGLAADLASQAVESAQVTGEANAGWSSGMAWFDTETIDAASLSLIADAGVDTAVVRPTAVSGTYTRSGIETRSGTVSAVATDAGLDATFADGSNAFERTQRWRAETAVIALESLETGLPVDPIVTAPPQDWSPAPAEANSVLDAWTSAEWIRPAALSELPGADDLPAAEPAAHENGPVLTSADARAIVRLDAETDAYVSMVGDAADGDYSDAILRASSARWRSDPDARAQYSSLISEDVRESLDGVRVVVRDSVTLTSSSGEFPLTIENSLEQAVTVSLEVRSSNSDRLTIDDVPAQVVQPGEKVTVAVSAEAKANGRVPVTVQLVNANGDPIGLPQQTFVNAAEYGTIAWTIVGAAGLLFGAGLVRRAVNGRTRPENGDNLEPSSDEPVEKVAQ